VGEAEDLEARDKVAGLWDFIGGLEIGEIYRALAEGFAEALGNRDVVFRSLEPREISLALTLYREKYSRDEWNIYGIDPGRR
jgi:lipoate-protein ligase A